jgi:hypothetical protein
MRKGENADSVINSELGWAVAFVQTPAARTARQEGAGLVFKFETAKGATQDIAEGGSLPALPAPFVKKPRQKDGPQHDAEVDQDEVIEADGNHGDFDAGA